MSVSTFNSAPSVALDRERDRPHPLQIELYRRATPTQKLAVVARLNATALALKEATLLSRCPDMPATERREALRRWWLGARD
jgi:hypothetical protein